MKVSVIIPTFNRAELLARTLQSLENQNIEQTFEVIVVDNGSTDNTKEVCQLYKEKIKDLIYAYDAEPGLLTGRHKGVELAGGEVFCFLDDDVELNVLYIKGVIEVFTAHKDVYLATGPCLPEYQISPPSWISYFWTHTPEGKFCHWLSLLDFGQKEIIINPNYVFGLNFCVRREIFDKVGGFNPDCIPESLQKYQGNGETGLTMKAIQYGLKAFYSYKLGLKHYITEGRLSESYFAKRAFYEGVSNSFTHIRQASADNKTKKTLRQIKGFIWPVYYRIGMLFRGTNTKSLPGEIQKLKNTLSKSEKDGYNFHQNAFKTDKKVRDWVLKANYWDYKLPRES